MRNFLLPPNANGCNEWNYMPAPCAEVQVQFSAYLFLALILKGHIGHIPWVGSVSKWVWLSN